MVINLMVHQVIMVIAIAILVIINIYNLADEVSNSYEIMYIYNHILFLCFIHEPHIYIHIINSHKQWFIFHRLI